MVATLQHIKVPEPLKHPGPGEGPTLPVKGWTFPFTGRQCTGLSLSWQHTLLSGPSPMSCPGQQVRNKARSQHSLARERLGLLKGRGPGPEEPAAVSRPQVLVVTSRLCRKKHPEGVAQSWEKESLWPCGQPAVSNIWQGPWILGLWDPWRHC